MPKRPKDPQRSMVIGERVALAGPVLETRASKETWKDLYYKLEIKKFNYVVKDRGQAYASVTLLIRIRLMSSLLCLRIASNT